MHVKSYNTKTNIRLPVGSLNLHLHEMIQTCSTSVAYSISWNGLIMQNSGDILIYVKSQIKSHPFVSHSLHKLAKSDILSDSLGFGLKACTALLYMHHLIWTHCLDLSVVRGCTVKDCVNNNMLEHTQTQLLPATSPRSASHMSDLCSGPCREPTSHPQQPDDCLQRGFPDSPHPFATTGVNTMCHRWQMLRMCSGGRRVCGTMAQWEAPPIKLSNMIRSGGPRGLWISRKESSILFQLAVLVRSHWQPGIEV